MERRLLLCSWIFREKVISFRVDRIPSVPEIIEKESYPQPKDFDLNEFKKSVFFMYEGEKVEVYLRCDNSLMKTIINRFGEDVTTLAYDMERVKMMKKIDIIFCSFLLCFGRKIN